MNLLVGTVGVVWYEVDGDIDDDDDDDDNKYEAVVDGVTGEQVEGRLNELQGRIISLNFKTKYIHFCCHH